MNIYQEYGFNNREDYLKDLAECYDVGYNTVEIIADLYGPSEDFDGLITTLEDYEESLFSD
jgi:hypothetical protein